MNNEQTPQITPQTVRPILNSLYLKRFDYFRELRLRSNSCTEVFRLITSTRDAF